LPTLLRLSRSKELGGGFRREIDYHVVIYNTDHVSSMDSQP
jgi:hypothetical protein